MKSSDAIKRQGAVRAAVSSVLALSLLATSAGAVTFTQSFPFQNKTFQSGSFKAVGNLFLDSFNYVFAIDYISGTSGAQASAISPAGQIMATVADRAITPGCSPPPGLPCVARFQSAFNPAKAVISIF